MRVKLDENLPEALLAALVALGHDVDNVRWEGLVGQPEFSTRLLASQSLTYRVGRPLHPPFSFVASAGAANRSGCATTTRADRTGGVCRLHPTFCARGVD